MKILLVAASVWGCLQALGTAHAQSHCPAASDIRAEQLIGRWDVELQTRPPTRWTLELQAHPEHEGSLRGTLTHATQQALVVADWDDGELTMEESHDGQRIAATWLGSASPGQCGQQIEGLRQSGDAISSAPLRFTMRSRHVR